ASGARAKTEHLQCPKVAPHGLVELYIIGTRLLDTVLAPGPYHWPNDAMSTTSNRRGADCGPSRRQDGTPGLAHASLLPIMTCLLLRLRCPRGIRTMSTIAKTSATLSHRLASRRRMRGFARSQGDPGRVSRPELAKSDAEVHTGCRSSSG